MTKPPFDPNDPDILHATGTGKKQGGWLGAVLAVLTIGAMLVAWRIFN